MFENIGSNEYDLINLINSNNSCDNINNTEIEAVLKVLQKYVDIFRKTYRRKVKFATTVGINRALCEYKNTMKLIDNFRNIVSTKYNENLMTSDRDFYKNIYEKIEKLPAELAFFKTEINSLSSVVKKKLKLVQIIDLIKILYNMLVGNLKLLSPILQISLIVTGTLLLICAFLKLVPAFIEFIRKLLIMLNTANF